jgi:NADH-quinone oxidoreductase subunit C
MTIDEAIKNISDKFGSRILKVVRKSVKRAYVDIYPKDIVEVARHIFKDMGFRFNIASAVDDFDGLEVLYHFSHDASGIIISVRALLKDKNDPHIDTITDVTRSAWWIEREIHELFGIEFDGNKDLRTLLLPDDWPAGVYPLRKSFVTPKRDSRKEDRV